MPTLLTPPNPAPVEEQPAKIKVSAGRYGELDHHELVRLLDSLDDDRSRSRFRESIYISLLFYCVLAWFVLYGPRVLWHTPQVVPVATDDKKHEMTYLETPSNLSKLIPKDAKKISDKTAVAQTAHPTQQKLTPEELEAMRRAGHPSPAPAPSAKPLPPTPQPQQAQAAPAPQPKPLPQVAQTRPQPNPNIPDAPRPSPSLKPNFGSAQSPGDSIAEAARDAALARGTGQGGEEGAGATPRHIGTNTGAEILSDTLGVDFGPYIKRLLAMVRASWIPLIPEETRPPLSKEGSTLIRFTIQKDGTLSFMHLDASTHDEAIDRAAWGGIKGVGQYPPLPPDFKGQELDLRIQFNIKQYRRNSAE